jgi:ATP-dependent DNA helicase RecQ
MQITEQNLEVLLKNRFDLDAFREGQLEAICTLMEKNRLLCIQPTGHGKSLLYQMPAVLLDGMTLVISPLLALMRDQISQLTSRFNIPAASINSDQSEYENNVARIAARAGKIKILFVAPEQLEDIDRFDFLLALPINWLSRNLRGSLTLLKTSIIWYFAKVVKTWYFMVFIGDKKPCAVSI